MDLQKWIEGIDGLASLYSFDILEDGSFSEIRLMGVNNQNMGMLMMNPNAPEFYRGIPYRTYWMDLNFESFVYRCASNGEPLYSYVNARGVWLKGFYIPVTGFDPVTEQEKDEKTKTVYCLYIINYSNEVEADSISQKSSEVAKEIMDLSVKLHEKSDFYQAMASAVEEIKRYCGAEKCSIYTVDKVDRVCEFINEDGLQKDFMEEFAAEMGRTPYEVAEAWEEDLALSDCLLLDDLEVVKERDPVWYKSLTDREIKNIILYAVRNNQELVGYIWAANFDTSKMMEIKEALELTTFLIAAVISNHHLVSKLEIKSTVDGLTGLGNRNAMNDRVESLVSGENGRPESLGVVYADLNGLKAVNDKKGHDAGDKLLKRASSLLKIAFGDDEIYRAGGDEFLIFCPEISGKKLKSQISRLRGLADNTEDVSFAIGSVYCTGEYNINDAMQKADEDMYRDKREYYLSHPEKDRRRAGNRA
ncbi:MAG: sensor domain-containing diguanylate cyclase [Lachnospiraceae bacterium]|nr:sensor domain-containing diguanylate cyclase [Lachnospiraceae bacterium]